MIVNRRGLGCCGAEEVGVGDLNSDTSPSVAQEGLNPATTILGFVLLGLIVVPHFLDLGVRGGK